MNVFLSFRHAEIASLDMNGNIFNQPDGTRLTALQLARSAVHDRESSLKGVVDKGSRDARLRQCRCRAAGAATRTPERDHVRRSLLRPLVFAPAPPRSGAGAARLPRAAGASAARATTDCRCCSFWPCLAEGHTVILHRRVLMECAVPVGN